jgi:hypothetical protein
MPPLSPPVFLRFFMLISLTSRQRDRYNTQNLERQKYDELSQREKAGAGQDE